MPSYQSSIPVRDHRIFFAEQAFLSKSKAFKFARIAKFAVGWASHLYYWVYPGVMVAVTAILVGYLAGQLLPSVFSSAVPSPLLMVLFAIVFPFSLHGSRIPESTLPLE